MRRKMRPEQFPAQYFDIAEKVGGKNEVLEVQITELNQAHRLRGHFYLFKGVVRDHAERALDKQPADRTPTDLEHIQLLQWLDKVSFWVDKETITAKFINRDQSFYGQLLSTMKASPGPNLAKSFREKELEDSVTQMAIRSGQITPAQAEAAAILRESTAFKGQPIAPYTPPHAGNKAIPPNPMNSYVPPKEPKE